jgi:hypothetical protein
MFIDRKALKNAFLSIFAFVTKMQYKIAKAFSLCNNYIEILFIIWRKYD